MMRRKDVPAMSVRHKPGVCVVLFMTLALAVLCRVNAQTHWTGDGGKGKSIAIVAPQATGLLEGFEYLPELVQGELVSNFATFSAINVLDRQSLDKVYLELMSGVYADDAEAVTDLGNLVPSQYILGGKITRTNSGYALQLQVTRTAKDDKTTVASYSGTCSFHELDNLTGVRRASKVLLENMGVTLTDQAKTALAGAAAANHVSAQTALAHGIVAQRQGTEVAALSYFYQAAAFDPSLAEAVGRSTIMAANISSTNIGENIRNDILWQRAWKARLNETEEAFYKMLSEADPPYKLIYFPKINTGNINYQTGTADLNITIDLHANREWFAAMNNALLAAKAVMAGLNATNRKNDWGFGRWPSRGQGVSANNPFGGRSWQHNLTVEFELVDQQGRVIGKQTAALKPSFGINSDFTVNVTNNAQSTVTFKGVKADDISDHLTIRPALINGKPPELARFPVMTPPTSQPLGAASQKSDSQESAQQKAGYWEERIGLTEMVFVKGGTFTMGCTPEQGRDCDKDERPAHSVAVGDFYIGKYEVTQRLWKAVMGNRNNPSKFKGDDLPVENVSYKDVGEFLKKLGELTGTAYLTPTEAQWEYAARGGNKSGNFKYAGSNAVHEVAWHIGNSASKTHPVGTTRRANELGIYDMSGNVSEWVMGRSGSYTKEPKTDPLIKSGDGIVFRGGGYESLAKSCRVSRRANNTPDYRHGSIGFRLAIIDVKSFKK